jgi:hypothetical protein
MDQLRVYGLMGYYFLEVRGERGPIRQNHFHDQNAEQTGKALWRAGA